MPEAVDVQSTIIAGNSDTSGTAPDVFGSYTDPSTSQVYSTANFTNCLLCDNTGSGLAAAPVGSPDVDGNLVGTSTDPVDPKLGPLADNGGPTQTCALLKGSPAIDMGSNPANLPTDQRGSGFVREAGATSDMGSYEYQTAVTGISPAQGPATGGTTVTIAGTAFTGATAVHFGSTAAAAFVVDSDTQITAVSPAGTGVVDVTVTTSTGTSATSSADQFSYQVTSPTTTTVTSNYPTSVYGQSVTFTATVTASSGSDPTGTVQFLIDNVDYGSPVTLVDGTAQITTSALSAASHDIAAIYSSDSDNFADSSTNPPFTQVVGPAPLTIRANDQTMVYGGQFPMPFTAAIAGLVNDDTAATLGTLIFSTTATSTSHVGSYSITVSGATDSNYDITYVSGTLTVTPAPLTITADNQTKVYGAPLPVLTASYSGFVDGDSSASLGTLPSLSTTATASNHVGAYTITASGATDADYTISYVGGTLTVAPAPVTITADNQTKVYGASLPALTASYAGFVNGDSSVSLDTLPSLSTTATAASHVDTYTITAGGAADADYTISYVAGTLTITPASPSVSVSDSGGTYDGLPFAAVATVSGVNGSPDASLEGVSPTLTYYVGSSAEGTGSTMAPCAAGTYTVVASFPGSDDYGPVQQQAIFTIGKATPVINVCALDGVCNGLPLPATATVVGIVPGADTAPGSSLEGVRPTLTYYAGNSPIGNGSTIAPSAAGTYTVMASFAGSANYLATQSGPATFAINPSPPLSNVTEGNPSRNVLAAATTSFKPPDNSPPAPVGTSQPLSSGQVPANSGAAERPALFTRRFSGEIPFGGGLPVGYRNRQLAIREAAAWAQALSALMVDTFESREALLLGLSESVMPTAYVSETGEPAPPAPPAQALPDMPTALVKPNPPKPGPGKVLQAWNSRFSWRLAALVVIFIGSLAWWCWQDDRSIVRRGFRSLLGLRRIAGGDIKRHRRSA